MTVISRSALVTHSAQAMYDLVNDVASYPEFMDGCVGVEIFEHNEHSMLARLDLKKAGMQISFVTRNRLEAPHQIEMKLQDGPFKMFKGLWSFKSLTESACKVSLDLEFEFSRKGLGLAGSSLFAGVANNLVDSLCQRADKVLLESNND